MKRFLIILLALGVHGIAFGEVLRFFVLPKDATAPEVRSSLRAYQELTPKMGAAILEVDSLSGAEPTTTRSVGIVRDANGKVTEEAPRQVPSVKITLPSGFQEKFGKITEENVTHRIMIVLGDRILMAPFVNQRIDTSSFLISLGSTVTSEEAAHIIEDLRSMVKKQEANHSPEPTPSAVH